MCSVSLLVVDAQFLLLGDQVEDELSLDRVLGTLLQVLVELFLGLLLALEELRERHPGVPELLLKVLLARGQLVGEQALGDRHVDQGEDLLEYGVAGVAGLLEALAALQAGAHVGLQLLGGVELRRGLREVVVEPPAAPAP